jgi:enoyl-CoA hydratase
MAFEHIVVSIQGPVALLQLNRPKVLNALNSALMIELGQALDELDANEAVRCLIIHGNERAFSAGADIEDMKSATPVEMLRRNWIAHWDRLRRFAKPTIAAVSGYCIGGGCELAMACDIIVASESAQFGQTEINLGVIPGAGGTQRLARAIGKSRAMELILTVEVYLEEAKSLAREIASKAPVAARMAKEAVNKVYELPLGEGLEYERRLFYLLFSTEDQKEGMAAFSGKRKPEWRGK